MCVHAQVNVCAHITLLPHPLFFFCILSCPKIVFLHVCPHTCYLTLPLERKVYEDRDLVSLIFYFQCPEQCLTHNTVPYLLRQNSHTTQFTSGAPRFLVYSQSCVTITTTGLRTFSSPQKETPYPSAVALCSPSTFPPH